MKTVIFYLQNYHNYRPGARPGRGAREGARPAAALRAEEAGKRRGEVKEVEEGQVTRGHARLLCALTINPISD